MSPIDHERYSERLSPYVRGELGPEEAEDVRAHLAGCALCRQEETALRALMALPSDDLGDEESDRLHAAVLRAIAEKPALGVVPSKAAFVEPRRSWMPRIAQFMAAAAVIALATIYFTNPQIGPVGGDDSDAPATTQFDSEQGELEAQDGGGDRVAEGAGSDAAGDSIADSSGGGGSTPETGRGSGGRKRNGADGDRGSGTQDTIQGIAAPGEADQESNAITASKPNPLSFGAGVGFRGQR